MFGEFWVRPPSTSPGCHRRSPPPPSLLQLLVVAAVLAIEQKQKALAFNVEQSAHFYMAPVSSCRGLLSRQAVETALQRRLELLATINRDRARKSSVYLPIQNMYPKPVKAIMIMIIQFTYIKTLKTLGAWYYDLGWYPSIAKKRQINNF